MEGEVLSQLSLMSYAQQGSGARASARDWKAKSTAPRSGDAFSEETQKVQDCVRKITLLAGDIQKEVRSVSTSPGHTGRDKAQAAVQEAKALNDTGVAALQSLSRTITHSADGIALAVSEQNSRKFMHQKLQENLATSIKAVDKAFTDYEAAEAEARRNQAATSTMATPLVSAGVPGLDPALPPAEERQDQSSLQSQAVQMGDTVPAETSMHVAIVEEYARDLTNLNQDMQSLARAMTDLADVTRAQGEVLDDIENNMASAADQTAQANEQLVETARAQQRGGWRFLWLLLAAGSVAAGAALLS